MKFSMVSEVKDAAVVDFDRYYDDRGHFQEFYSSAKYPQDYAWDWEQTNYSCSHEDVIRGIHRAPYAKLVTCVKGRIFDVVVDLRHGSPTYLQWYGVWLSSGNHKQLYVPPDCGHAFYAERRSIVVYLQSGIYDPKTEVAVNPLDKDLYIGWPAAHCEYVISDKDRNAPTIAQLVEQRR